TRTRIRNRVIRPPPSVSLPPGGCRFPAIATGLGKTASAAELGIFTGASFGSAVSTHPTHIAKGTRGGEAKHERKQRMDRVEPRLRSGDDPRRPYDPPAERDAGDDHAVARRLVYAARPRVRRPAPHLEPRRRRGRARGDARSGAERRRRER